MISLDRSALAAALILLVSGCASAPATEGQAAATDAAPALETSAPAPSPQAPSPPAGGDASPSQGVTPSPEGPVMTPEQIEALRTAARQAPDDKRARRRLAIALFETGAVDEALGMFEEDVRTDPGTASLLNLGRAYDRVLRYGDAEATYRKVLALAPTHPTALHALGNLAMKRGDIAEAEALYRRAIASKPDYLMAYVHLADALKQEGQTQAAYDTYAHATELKPSTPQDMELYQDAVYNLAVIDLAAGSADQAADLLSGLLKVRPDHPSAHYAYGQALLALGREDEAQREFATHMKLQAARRPTSPSAMGD